ncbi:MAG: methylated-DNA--[protein]-cysteine S-methyltransferase [Nitrospirales bacterium]|nr:methylated-DNA--[protein]-cysteine S-methyltransferase [Nitrospirales bacterium]
MQTTIFKTKWGWIGLAVTPKGVAAVVLPKPTRRAVELELNGRGVIYHAQDGRNKLRPYTEQSANGTGVPSGHLRTARAAIIAYLAGKARSFALPLDWGDHSPFQMKVWEVLRGIPYGRVRSYGWVARKIGKPRAARAVGSACGANPVPLLVPCHRIVAGDGSLGGFSGGLPNKKRLLKLEGIRF